MPKKNSSNPAPTPREIIITRVIDAPRTLVWQAWTDPAHVAHWWGPKGFTNPVCNWTAQPGRTVHVVMRAPDGTDYPMGGEFREVVAPGRLVFTTGAMDAKGKMLFEFLHCVTFTEHNRQTTVKIVSRLTRAGAGTEHYTDGFEAGMSQSLERLAGLFPTTADREIVISRVVDAPRALVWQAWTDPEHVVKWWGPRGFSDTTKQHDFRVGGVWEHVLHGPDGANYPNKSTFKEIIPQESITFSHGGGREDGPGASFTATWTFETVEGTKTRVTGRMVFPTAAARDFVAKEFGAVEGGKQTLERLAEHLPTMQMREFVVTREFAAPRALVWAAWTQQAHLSRWFGPKGFSLTVGAYNFQPGGLFHYGMKSADGHEMWGKWIFKEIVPPHKLVVVVSFSDAQGDVARHPLSATWPLETLATTTFTEHAGKTTVTLRWIAYNATADERKTFDGAHDSMTQGWGGTMEQLTAYLADIQQKA